MEKRLFITRRMERSSILKWDWWMERRKEKDDCLIVIMCWLRIWCLWMMNWMESVWFEMRDMWLYFEEWWRMEWKKENVMNMMKKGKRYGMEWSKKGNEFLYCLKWKRNQDCIVSTMKRDVYYQWVNMIVMDIRRMECVMW